MAWPFAPSFIITTQRHLNTTNWIPKIGNTTLIWPSSLPSKLLFFKKDTSKYLTKIPIFSRKYADICPLLDVEDMVMFEKPDWKCVFTYVQSFFRRFRNGRDPPVPTKKLTLTPPPKATPASKSIEVSNDDDDDKKSPVATAAKNADPKSEPYYFPAPEISEEKKLSLMQKYLI